MMTTEASTSQASTILSGAATKGTYVGAGIAAVGGMSASDIAAFGGLALAAAGFATNFYFRWRDDQRAQREHAQRMCHIERRSERRVGMPDARSEPVDRRTGERRQGS